MSGLLAYGGAGRQERRRCEWLMRILVATALMATSGSAVAGPRLLVPVTSGDQVGVTVQGKVRAIGGVAALVGMWSDDGALELGGFEDRSRRTDPAIARAAEIVSGRVMHARGLRLTGRFYRTRDADRRGWTLSIDARRQRVRRESAASSPFRRWCLPARASGRVRGRDRGGPTDTTPARPDAPRRTGRCRSARPHTCP
jgi:hypothetical protein